MTPNKRDLKAYARFDGTGRIVPGSLVLRRSIPKNGNWKQVQAYECCDGVTTCTDPLVMTVIPDGQFFEFGMRVNSGNTVKGTIEWGDGTSLPFDFTAVAGYQYLGHTYPTPDYIPQTVKVYFTSTAGFDNLEIGSGDVVGQVLSVSNLSVFAGSTIDQVDADRSLIVSLDVSGLPIQQLYALECPNLAYLNVQGCTSLSDTELFSGAFQNLDFSGCSNLEFADVSNNINMDTLVIDDCPFLIYLIANDCNLTQSNVDYIINTLDNNGLYNGNLYLDGGTNAAPSGASATALANLISKLWVVNTN